MTNKTMRMTCVIRMVIVQPSLHARLLGFAGRLCPRRVIRLHSPVIVVERHLLPVNRRVDNAYTASLPVGDPNPSHAISPSSFDGDCFSRCDVRIRGNRTVCVREVFILVHRQNPGNIIVSGVGF